MYRAVPRLLPCLLTRCAPPQVSSATRGQGRLRRMSTTLHVDDPAAKETIQAAMADLSQTAGGRDAVAGLLKKHKTSTTA